MRNLWLWVVLLLLVACEAPPEAPPTLTRLPSLAPSPTVLPLVSPEALDQTIGRSDPTAAALAAEGEPSQDAPITPFPTEATIPMSIPTEDGVVLQASYYGAPVQPAPAILLVQSSLINTPLANFLQSAGYNVLLLTLRGDGQDWANAGLDITAGLGTLGTLPITPQVAVIAAGRGSPAATVACQASTLCYAVVHFNPVEEGGLILGQKPALVLVGQDAPESLAAVQGLTVQTYPSLNETVYPPVVAWLASYLPPN